MQVSIDQLHGLHPHGIHFSSLVGRGEVGEEPNIHTPGRVLHGRYHARRCTKIIINLLQYQCQDWHKIRCTYSHMNPGRGMKRSVWANDLCWTAFHYKWKSGKMSREWRITLCTHMHRAPAAFHHPMSTILSTLNKILWLL